MTNPPAASGNWQHKTTMTEEHFPETPQEINCCKLAMFQNQREFVMSKNNVSKLENEWLQWSEGRCAELEAIV